MIKSKIKQKVKGKKRKMRWIQKKQQNDRLNPSHINNHINGRYTESGQRSKTQLYVASKKHFKYKDPKKLKEKEWQNSYPLLELTKRKLGGYININVDREQIWANSSIGHKILNIYAPPKKDLQNTWNKSDRKCRKDTNFLYLSQRFQYFSLHK